MSSLGGDDVSQLVADVMGDGMLLPGAPPSTTGTPTVRVTPSPNAQVTIPVTSLAGSPSSRNLAAPSLRGTQHDTQTPSMDTSSGCGVGAGAEAAAVGSRAGARSSAVGPLHSARHIASVAQTHSLVRRRSSRSPHSGYVKTSARRRAMLENLDAAMLENFTSQNLRRLFRVFDRDNDQRMTHREFQKGLEELGILAANDVRAVSKFLEQIDVDKTGFITEMEFIAYFKGLKKKDIATKLTSLSQGQNTLSMRVTEYGIFTSDIRQQMLSCHEVLPWLEHHQTETDSRVKRWIDVWGYNPNLIAQLAQEFDIHPETLKDAVLFQAAKVEVVRGSALNFSERRAQILLHLITMENMPFQEENGTTTLVDKDTLSESPPKLVFEQVSIIIVDDNTLISIRADADVDTPIPPSQELFDRVARRLMNTDALLPVQTSSVKHLAFDLVDIVLQQNYVVRDALKEWEVTLEGSIRDKAASVHTAHLYLLAKLAGIYKRTMEPFGTILSWQQWKHAGCADFFAEQEVLFRELYDDVSSTVQVAEALKESVKVLKDLYKQIQADQMNKVLYILTITTTVFIPAQFLTGLYGMNFEVIPELKWNYSYLVFWIACVLLMGTVALLFKKLRLFTV